MSTLVAKPTITLSTLAKAMGPLSPAALARLLSGHKRKAAGPRRSYQAARRQAIEHLTEDVPLDPDAALRTYERDAVRAMQRMRLRLPAWTRAVRARRALPPWELAGVTISMQPDVDLESGHATGAGKIVFTKAPLARGVGSTMAALLWHYRRNVLGIESTDVAHCIVWEPRLPWLHLPSRRPERQVKDAQLARTLVAAIWPSVA